MKIFLLEGCLSNLEIKLIKEGFEKEISFHLFLGLKSCLKMPFKGFQKLGLLFFYLFGFEKLLNGEDKKIGRLSVKKKTRQEQKKEAKEDLFRGSDVQVGVDENMKIVPRHRRSLIVIYFGIAGRKLGLMQESTLNDSS